jgi:hypothetical protein
MQKIQQIFHKIFIYPIIKVFLSFLFVNGIVFCLQEIKLLKVIDYSILKILSSLHTESKSIVLKSHSNSIVLILDDLYYEKYFNATSPLDTKELSYILEKIAIQKPKAIVLDFDISPDYNFKNPKIGFEARDIDTTLAKIQASGTKILLPFSFTAETEENKKTKQDWFEYICSKDITLGIPTLKENFGVSLLYFGFSEHISNLAHSHSDSSICSKIVAKTKISDIKDEYTQTLKKDKEELSINFTGIQKRTFYLSTKEQLENIDIKDKTVFLGGSYGYSDKYLIPGTEVNGVEILEAIYYTLSHRIEEADIFLSSIIDILNGLAFGWILNRLLLMRKKQFARTHYEIYTLLNLFIFGVLISWIGFSLQISATVFESFYIWLNPIPIILGMFIDAIFTATSLEESRNSRNRLKSKCLYPISPFKSVISNILRVFFVFIGIYSLIGDYLCVSLLDYFL